MEIYENYGHIMAPYMLKKTSNYNERPNRITNTNDIHYRFPDTQD